MPNTTKNLIWYFYS